MSTIALSSRFTCNAIDAERITISGKRSTLPSALRCSIFLGTCPSHSPRTNTPATPPTPVDLEHVEKRTHFPSGAGIFRSAVRSGITLRFFDGIYPPSPAAHPSSYLLPGGRRLAALGIEMRATFRPRFSSPLSTHPSMQNVHVRPARTGRPGRSQAAAAGRGHVHAPYTSPGSGVAAGLKGRYTHRELRWGRPTWARPCVGVGDSTPQ